MDTYLGSILLVATDTFGYCDIRPPTRDGYASRLVSVQWVLTGDCVDNQDHFVQLACSARSPGRTSLAVADMLDGDIIKLNSIYYNNPKTVSGDSECCDQKKAHVPPEDALFAANLRIMLVPKYAISTAKTMSLYLRVGVEQVKLTPAIRDQLINRVYESSC